jgi:hypothetical protein
MWFSGVSARARIALSPRHLAALALARSPLFPNPGRPGAARQAP